MSQVTSPIILDSTGRSIASGLAGLADAISSRPAPAEDTPIMDGVGDVGTSLKYAREDHVHPADTAKQDAIAIGTMSLSTTWSGSGPYTQTATITGVTLTANSKVDIQLTAAQTADLIDDGVIALIPENNNGTVTVTALGAAPSSALTLQITVTEVA